MWMICLADGLVYVNGKRGNLWPVCLQGWLAGVREEKNDGQYIQSMCMERGREKPVVTVFVGLTSAYAKVEGNNVAQLEKCKTHNIWSYLRKLQTRYPESR